MGLGAALPPASIGGLGETLLLPGGRIGVGVVLLLAATALLETARLALLALAP